MPLTPFPIETFGPIDLNDDSTEGIGQARDIKNLRLDRPGRLTTRGGFTTRLSSTQSGVVGYSRFRTRGSGGGDSTVAIQSANTLRVYAAGLASSIDLSPVSTGTFSGAGLEFGFANFWAARTDNTLVLLDGLDTALGKNNTPQAHFLTVTAVSRRMVAAYADIGAAPINGRVYFSDPGNALSWPTTNWVDVPTIGSTRAAVRYRDLVFVFSDRLFVVFTGESTLNDGSPVFNYRPVDVGIGCAYDFGAAVGPDGVYFIAHNGIYRTTGGPPVLVSRPIQPIFDAATDSSWNGPASITTPRLYATNDRLYFINNAQILYYDFATGAWAYSSYAPGVQFMVETPAEVPRAFYFIDGTGKACEAGDTFTTDDGTAIAWAYQTGYSSAGGYFRQRIISSGERKKHFKTDILGSGTVTHQLLTLNGRPNDVADPGASVTLGTAPALARGSRRRGVRGTHFAHKLSGSGPASINGLTYWLSEISQDT